MFKDGDLVKFIGYTDYFATFGTLVSQGTVFVLNALVKEDDIVKMRQYDLLFTDQGYLTKDRSVGILLKKTTKANYTRFVRQLTKGTINWGPGELNG